MPAQRVRSEAHRSSRARAVQKALGAAESFTAELVELFLLLLAPLVFGLGPRFTLGATIGVASLPIQIFVVLFWLTFLFGMVVSISTERFARGNFRRQLELYGQSRWEHVAVIAALTGVLLMAWTTFSGLTCVFRDLGWAHLSPDFPAAECLARLQDHYAWHFLESIPGFEVPETLHWAPPYTYSDTTTGVLILAYKAAIVLPLIGGYRLWRRIITEEKGPRLDPMTRLRRLFA